MSTEVGVSQWPCDRAPDQVLCASMGSPLATTSRFPTLVNPTLCDCQFDTLGFCKPLQCTRTLRAVSDPGAHCYYTVPMARKKILVGCV